MATTLPAFTKTIDNAFLTTWYDIRPEAIDNITKAIVVWAALQDRGRFTKQVGGNIITRTVQYDTAESQVEGVAKGDVLSSGEKEFETMARWTWRYLTAPIQRTTIDDQQNAGKYQIKSYLAQRMKYARQAVKLKYEGDTFRASDSTETAHKFIQSLTDVVPAYADRATGTYGLISRGNSWWVPKYKQFTLPKEVNMLSDMKNLYNTCGRNKDYPDLIITDQTMFELYEEFALDQSQLIKQGGNQLADLGFQTLKFKGADIIWTDNSNFTAGEMVMLNTQYIELVYDPNYWFAMSEFVPVPSQLERIARIICTANLISDRLEAHGRLYN